MGYRKLKKRVEVILKNQLDKSLTYHGYHHAKDVYKCVNAAVKRNKFEDDKSDLFRIAALTHDICYVDTYKGHEERGVEIVTGIMLEEGYNKKDIAYVKKLILATKPEKRVRTLEEKIMKDADLDYLGRADFYKVAKSLYDEWVANGIIINDFNLFEKQELHFLINHKYLTDYARDKRGPGKKKRIAELKKKLDL